jgi:isopentenyldiphosphate isomerase
MALEYFDVLDCTGKKTGDVISRDEAHRTGAWHGAFHCLIVYEREGRSYALFQKRSLDKKIAPGMFDVSVGGHYAAGEDAQTAGPREIKEELGLAARFEDLVSLGRRVFVYCSAPNVVEQEIQDVFFLSRAVEPRGLALQQEEVDGVLEMTIDSGIRLFSGSELHVRGSLFSTGILMERVNVSAGEFVPCLDNYYLKLLLLARRYLKGERELLMI